MLLERFAASPYRAGQLFKWVYRKHVLDPLKMSDLSKTLRRELAALFCFPSLRLIKRLISADGSRKYVLEGGRGDLVEAVMVHQEKRLTLCVSSQVGCALGCIFCRTGSMGYKRNLSASEMVRQILVLEEDAKNFKQSFQNIVFMGMGEPLQNIGELRRALAIIGDNHGLGVSGRRVTVSTAGLVPAIDELGSLGLDVNLAVSLNATTDEVRSFLMPINKAYPLQKLLESLRRFPLKRRKRITIEYVLIAGVNDSDGDLHRLPGLLHGLRVKINLIPYNPAVRADFRAPPLERLNQWHDTLLKKGIETTIRWSKGSDIQGACGQLAA